MLATYILMDVISVKYLELFRWKMPCECQELLLLFLSPAFPMGLSFPVTFVRPLQPASCSVACHPSDILHPSRGCDRIQSKSSWNIVLKEVKVVTTPLQGSGVKVSSNIHWKDHVQASAWWHVCWALSLSLLPWNSIFWWQSLGHICSFQDLFFIFHLIYTLIFRVKQMFPTLLRITLRPGESHWLSEATWVMLKLVLRSLVHYLPLYLLYCLWLTADCHFSVF